MLASQRGSLAEAESAVAENQRQRLESLGRICELEKFGVVQVSALPFARHWQVGDDNSDDNPDDSCAPNNGHDSQKRELWRRIRCTVAGCTPAPQRVAAAWCGPGDFTALLEDLQVAVDAFMDDVLAEHR